MRVCFLLMIIPPPLHDDITCCSHSLPKLSQFLPCHSVLHFISYGNRRWVLTPLVNRAFHKGLLLPQLGIPFLPLATLVYVLLSSLSEGGVSSWGRPWFILASLLDLGAHGSPIKRATQARRGKAVLFRGGEYDCHFRS